MKRNSDDDEDPFDDVRDGIEGLLSGAAGDDTALADVHERDDQITVVADIPGVERSDIDLRCDGRTLSIRASTETRSYINRVDLPAYVDDESASASYNNGVLEVTLDRTNDPANIGFQ